MLVNYSYKTLPHNRGAKTNNSVVRFSNEAEFITTQTSLTFNSPDIRYTVEGYPYVDDTNNFPSPPEAYKTVSVMDNAVTLLPPTVTLLNNRNYCTVQQDQKWPSILVPGYHLQSHEISENNVIHEEDEGEELCNDHSGNALKCLTKPVADSPDEGYVGDAHESSDI